jgi:hypothetical protein
MRYKGKYNETRECEFKQNFKNYLSSDWRLELAYMKSESLVIVNNHVTVNDKSNFAHTAHHARRVVTAGNTIRYLQVLLVKNLIRQPLSGGFLNF